MAAEALIEAIDDLIRVTIAMNSDGSRADQIRRLYNAGVKQARIAKILGIEYSRVTSAVSKYRKSDATKSGGLKD